MTVTYKEKKNERKNNIEYKKRINLTKKKDTKIKVNKVSLI